MIRDFEHTGPWRGSWLARPSLHRRLTILIFPFDAPILCISSLEVHAHLGKDLFTCCTEDLVVTTTTNIRCSHKRFSLKHHISSHAASLASLIFFCLVLPQICIKHIVVDLNLLRFAALSLDL